MTRQTIERAVLGQRPDQAAALALADIDDLARLTAAAARIRDAGFGAIVSYSRKVFIPLTQLCRDSCHYCTFAQPPRRDEPAFLTPDAVLAIAQAGRQAGCHEALFTLGDKPELRYPAARQALTRLGFDSTVSYLQSVAGAVLQQTGLLPHLNPGTMTPVDIARLRPVSASMGLMLETAAERLTLRGGPHFGSPDKAPAARLATIAAAGAASVPFTSGILIGIGETRRERIEALLAIRDLHDRFGHIQEIIVQNFRAKPGTRMADAAEPGFEDHLWTIAIARILFGSDIAIQAPPNLATGALARLIEAGVNDWGGVSPVTIDHVNPERPWPHLDRLADDTASAGKALTQRLAIYPRFVHDAPRWLDPALHTPVLHLTDAAGFGRGGTWVPGGSAPLEPIKPRRQKHLPGSALHDTINRARDGEPLSEADITALFAARGDHFWSVCDAADGLRRSVNGETVSYVVTRNINYTNICSYRCTFCAFSKGKLSDHLRGRPYNLALDEIGARVRQAWDRGATEVCLQGGIHPDYTGAHYLDVLAAVKHAAPHIHVHAFSPLEIWQGAATLGIAPRAFLKRLHDAGLGSLPGTAAEILDDAVRRVICPDKVTTSQWLEVIATAHEVGLRSTATILYGHVERPVHWARHIIRLRTLQSRTGGITEFVPLPFVPFEAPVFLKGQSRKGATQREAVLMHAVARLALHPVLPNIQTSWVKMGHEGAALCLQAGVNDLGGTLMDESISRAAGATHGQEMTPREMAQIAATRGRPSRQRTTLYAEAPAERRATAARSYELIAR